MAFGKISQQLVSTGHTVELVLNQIEGEPVLVVEHLGESNTEFWNDALAKAGVEANELGRKKPTAQAVKAARLKNREIIAKYSVRGLKNVFHDDGAPATMADVPDVINALPDDVFDSVLAFVRNPENFRTRAPKADPRDVAVK